MPTAKMPVGVMIKLIGEKLAQQSNQELSACDLTISQIQLLGLVAAAEDGLLCMKEAERKLHQAQSTVAGLAARLEAKGLIAYDVSEEDRRKKRLCITEAGRRVIDIGRGKVEAHERYLLSRLSEAEEAEFRRLLRIVLDTLNTKPEQGE